MTKENKNIVILAGYSAAGKSTLGKELRDNWGYGFIEHQPLVHDLAVNRGYERARHWLAAEGLEQFTSNSTYEMVLKTREMISNGKDKIVFDVGYGRAMLDLFKKEFPEIFILIVSVISQEDIRLEHIQKRMKSVSVETARTELNFRDGFLRQAGLDELLEQRDFEVTVNNRPVGEIAQELNINIRKFLNNDSNNR